MQTISVSQLPGTSNISTYCSRRLMKVYPYALFSLLACTLPAFATVTVTSPTSGATIPSPVHFVASATATTCAKGVVSMGIYVNNSLIYVVNGMQINTN